MHYLLDSHCHLDFPVFDQDRQEVIKRAKSVGVEYFVVPGVSADTWQRLEKFHQDFEANSCVGFGLHPYFTHQHRQKHLGNLEKKLKQTCAKFVGEIGLDFFDKTWPKQEQLNFFSEQVAIAKSLRLPVILHIRKAFDEVLAVLSEHAFTEGGIVHAFNGSQQQAKKLIARGFVLGFGGMLTHPQSRKLREKAKFLSLSDIVLETDSPDMATYHNRGKRNEPYFIQEVAATLSQLKDVELDEIAHITTSTSIKVLRLKTGEI
ncbi:MAG: TatD family hydrolase [Pseudomonadota bacterium]